MKPHFFISESDGALHDTRAANWSANPLRPNFARHHSSIETLADLKATLRAGEYAWPGGYQLYLVMADGEALSFDSARAEFRQLAAAFMSGDPRDSWRVIACAINYEDSNLYCAHSGAPIPAAYDPD